METVHICSLSQQSLMTKGPVIVYRPWIGEFRGKAINNDHPLINQETKEIKTSVFLIHRVAVTITTRSFASGRRNIFMHLHVLSKHFDTHKITEKRWQGKKRMCVMCVMLKPLDSFFRQSIQKWITEVQSGSNESVQNYFCCMATDIFPYTADILKVEEACLAYSCDMMFHWHDCIVQKTNISRCRWRRWAMAGI